MNIKLIVIFVVFIFNCFISINTFAQEKLIFAMDLIRHGDRTPTRSLPKIHYAFAEGQGQLTPLGMRQEFNLGKKFRVLYVDQYHLLPPHFAVETMLVRSTDVDRTLMSAESVLLGFYPLGSGPFLPDSGEAALPQGYQPVPIKTVPLEQENVLIPDANFYQFDKLLDKYVFTAATWQEKNRKLQPKYAAWSKATGVDIKQLNDLRPISDYLYISRLHHFPLPQGLSAQDSDEIIAGGRFAFVHTFTNPKINQITGKRLFLELANELEKAAKQKQSLKYILYSAHDSTLLNQLSLMGANYNEVPPYASDLNFSLFDKGQHQYIVRIKFNDKPVYLPACHARDCSLQEFVKLAHDSAQPSNAKLP